MTAKSGGPATTLLIPVSWGEFFDKISILEIKKENVLNGSAKNNIVEELELLTNFLSDDILNDTQLNGFRVKLKAINQKIWNIEDEIRVNEAKKDFGKKFIWLARSTYLNNDRRASIKRQINDTLNSAIVEEKIY